jgi:hypothetical protein
MKPVEKERKVFLSLKVKEAVKSLNAAVMEARNDGLSVEFKTNSCVMAEDAPLI